MICAPHRSFQNQHALDQHVVAFYDLGPDSATRNGFTERQDDANMEANWNRCGRRLGCGRGCGVDPAVVVLTRLDSDVRVESGYHSHFV